mmetsp:Transcript_97668/g.173984  ORF Transcript_97668/g.173984 Transcript_97668/m.173984 type:complete len:350 (+) Transcript_97668:56-1105(+)
MQPHYAHPAYAAPVIRGPAVAQFGVHGAAQHLDNKKAQVLAAPQPQRLPAQGATRIAAHSNPSATAVTAAVLSAPTPTTNAKIQPQLQNLPRFQPPVFEGVDGQLPRPDSPSSTPRGDDAQAESSEAPVQFAAGSFVEYKSRSSGQWITAKVEAYDAASQIYKLDVQQNAQADRVRAKRSSNVPQTEAGAGSPEHPGAAGASGRSSVDATPTRSAGKTPDQAQPPQRGVAARGQMGYEEIHPTQTDHFKVPVPEPAAEAAPQLQMQQQLHQQQMQRMQQMQQQMQQIPSPNQSLLEQEVEVLRKRVAALESENLALKEQVMHEASLKDRFRQELAEAQRLQRFQVQTPR